MQSFLCRLLHTEVNHGGSLASLSEPFSHLVLFSDGTLVAFLRGHKSNQPLKEKFIEAMYKER